MEAFGNDAKVRAELQRLQFWPIEPHSPFSQPFRCLYRVVDGVPECSHKVRFTLSATAQQHYGTCLVWLCGLKDLQEVN